MKIPRSSLLPLCLLLCAASAAAVPATPFDQEVKERRARFLKEAARPGSPAAVVPLLGLGALFEQVADRAALLAFVAEAAAHPGVLPDVRAHAQQVRRELLLHQRQAPPPRDEGTGELDELGLVQAWQVAGPFDNDGGKGHDTVFPPETETTVPQAGAAYEGKSRVIPPLWRAAPRAALGRDGRLLFDGMLRPDDWATAYAAAYLHNPGQRPLPIALRLGTSGAVKVWVNRGAPVLSHAVYRPLRPDQELAPAMLRPGWNRVLVKLSGNEGPWAFLLRVTAPDGRPLTGVRQSAAPPAQGWAIPAAAGPGPRPRGLLDGLRQAAKQGKGPARAQALVDLGLFLHHVVPGDPEKREDEEVLEQATSLAPDPSPRTYRLLGQAAREANDRRQALEAGVAQKAAGADPAERARLYHDLGKVYEEGRREHLAEGAYTEALRLCPTLYPVALALAQIHSGRGMVSEALRQLSAGTTATPDLLRGEQVPLKLLRGFAQLLSRAGRNDEAAAIYRRILTASQDDSEALRQLLDRDRNRGDVDAALSWLDRVIVTRPELLAGWAGRERVELLEGAGRVPAALAALDEALAVIEADAELHQLRGRLLLRLSRDDDALRAYRRALELRPQNPELRTYLFHLDPKARSGDDLSRAFRVEVPGLLKRAKAKPARAGEDPARVLLDQAVVRVHDNGLSESYSQRVVEILDDRGAREYADAEIRFTPETQSVEVKAARVYKPDGDVLEVAATGERDVSEPWYGLYYDVRAQTVRFDGLRPGDVIAIEYVISDVGRRNLLADYFGDLHFLQEEVPRLDSRYVLLVPAEPGRERPLYFNPPKGGPKWQIMSSQRVEVRGGARQRVYTFRAEDVPRIDSEPGMPGFTEVAAFVHVSTYRSWEEVATWYAGLIREQLQPSAEMVRAARAAVAGLKDERQRVRAIYDLVVKRTRYVGLEFGIHGYKPYKVAQVFSRKFGDCKDKAALLKVLLKEVGTESTMVLARTRRNGDLPREPASLAAFDHAIVYVPGLDLYLDGTAEWNGADELPADDQDIPVLLVSDPRQGGRGRFTRTPVLPAERSTVSRDLAVQLRADGGARVREKMLVSGQTAPRWREHYQSEGAQRERYEKAWNDHFPGAKVQRVELPHVADLERPVTLSGEVEVPAWGQQGQGDGAARKQDLVLRALGRDPDLLRSYARLSQRKHDLVLGFPWRNLERVQVRLPAGMAVRRAPEARRVESPFGWFELKVTRDTGEITVTAELQVNRHRVRREEYAAFRRFCAEVDRVVEQELVIGHE